MSDPYGELLHDVPMEYRERFVDLLDHTHVGLQILAEELESYLVTVRLVGPFVALIDVDEAERLGKLSEALIQLVPTSANAHAHTMVQAAIRYFITEDEDDEVTGVLGFDDDVQVMNAVCRALQRPDLVLQLTRRL